MVDEWKKWPIKEIHKESFPVGIRNLKDCPEKLYYRGNWNDDLFKRTVAIVGSRRMSGDGRRKVGEIVPGLVKKGMVVVSGFMYGVDSEAHRVCLESGGKTVAVLGSGLDVLAPANNDWLYSQILINEGIILSEYGPYFRPTRWSFPRRNRLVVALATVGVVVVEAELKSGSMLTANLALRQNVPLFAVSGGEQSSGIELMIEKMRAKIVKTAEDIF